MRRGWDRSGGAPRRAGGLAALGPSGTWGADSGAGRPGWGGPGPRRQPASGGRGRGPDGEGEAL